MSLASQADQARLDTNELSQKAINTIRLLAADAVEKAQSGHPGMPMGTAPMAYVLWTRFLSHNPNDPKWPNRDRFVLSAGHGSMLLYSLLHLTGYEAMTMEEIKNFRQWKSLTPGHPESFVTPGVDTTTGPLGQGFATAVGMAIAERFLAAQFNRPGHEIIDHYTYGICSDGDLMEGISHEAASIAGHLGLGKLIFLYDDNKITIDGSTDLSFSEDVGKRFEAYHWHVQHVEDGTDLDAIDAALRAAREDDRPSLIAVRTRIGSGSPNKEGTSAAHGEPLGEEEVRLTKRALGWPEDQHFYVPDEVYAHMRAAVERGVKAQHDWEERLEQYETAYPEEGARLRDWLVNRFPADWEDALPTFPAGKSMATRAAGGEVLNALGPKLPQLIGGSADLTPSNKTAIKGRTDFQKSSPNGAYFRFGVREHAMAAACNGMMLHGGLRPYCGTFLIFSDYMRPAVRLAALMEQPVLFVFTHDSIGLGEDGPTHQPVEHYMALRAIPNLAVFRPADANETSEAWRAALRRTEGPSALLLTRQNLPTVDRSVTSPASGLLKGAYVLSDDGGTPDLILMGSGSEVQHCYDAAQVLRKEGVKVRVVSMPCWELFEEQDQAYRDEVLPPNVTRRVSVEAGVTLGWERYVGTAGRTIGLDHYGASAPAETLMEAYGFTAENVVRVARELLG